MPPRYKLLVALGWLALAESLAFGAGCGGRALVTAEGADGSAPGDSSTPEKDAIPESSTRGDAAADSGPPASDALPESDAGAELDAAADGEGHPDGDAATSLPSDSGVAADVPVGPDGVGTVSFGFTSCQGHSDQTYCSAELWFSAAFLPAAEVCTPMTAGACQYSVNCGLTVGPTVGSGTIYVSGGPFDAAVSPNAGTGGDYLYFPPDGGALTPGEVFTASATGDTVPAWGPVSVPAAPPAKLLSPVDGATVPSTADLPVTWSGGQPGARFRVYLAPTVGFGEFVQCEWDATIGHGVIPAVALATALPNTPAGLLQAQVFGTSFLAGGYRVSVETVQGVEIGLDIQ